MTSRTSRLAICVASLFFCCESSLRAYTDPGSGAMLWQLVVAGFVGTSFYFRKLFLRIKSKTRKTMPPAN